MTRFYRGLVAAALTLAIGWMTLATAHARHRFITQGKGRLAIVGPEGIVEWEMPWGGIHDIHVLPNGNVMVQQGPGKIAEIDRQTKQVVWSYDSATQNGNAGKPVEVHAFQPLPDGSVMIAESGIGRIIEVDRAGKLLHSVTLKRNTPSTHSDTRLVRKLKHGHYLVAHEQDGFVREYDASGTVVWEYEVPMFDKPARPGHGPEAFGNRLFSATRLASGNTLIGSGNGHSVIEVSPNKKIVWMIGQNDLPGITLAWVTTVEPLDNGNYLIGNCHAGPGQPILIEVDPATKKVVWQFDGFDRFGNDVSNTARLVSTQGATSATSPIRHSFFVAGPTFTGIIDEAGKEIWDSGRPAARDGYVLPNGNALIAWVDEVVEMKPTKEVVFKYTRAKENAEIGTVQRLDNGHTLITELGAKPRLLEVDATGKIVVDVPLQPETDNAHMQTRMARKLANGNYLVPHLLAFKVKEYTPEGKVVREFATDLEELGGRAAENWPFTAIRLDNGNTLVNLTHGNKSVELDPDGKVVWKVTNDDLPGDPLDDPCGAQRLPNGNTVIASYHAQKGIKLLEVNPAKEIVWSYDGPHRVHHFQILSTNGSPLTGKILK
jgi:outer membrane protein assembly factor BamB